MKKNIIITLLLGILLFSACDHPMTLETNVNENGSLDKTITFEKGDSSLVAQNIFGINSTKGWTAEISVLPAESKETGSDKIQYKTAFNKHFDNVEQLNSDLNVSSDTLFQIKSSFDKKFRWFYTYIRYSETFQPINRFKMISPNDYLNAEDRQFINRLPGEGKSISKADSMYLQMLNYKVSDFYTTMAIFNEEFEIMIELAKRNNLPPNWMDTLVRKKEYIYKHVEKMKGEHNFALKMADSLHLPLNREKALKDLPILAHDLNSRVDFMSFANAGKYVNIINMPWTIVQTNADSIIGNKLIWRPVVNKFQFSEYEMYAEARKLNMWTIFASGIVVLGTLFLWTRRKV